MVQIKTGEGSKFTSLSKILSQDWYNYTRTELENIADVIGKWNPYCEVDDLTVITSLIERSSRHHLLSEAHSKILVRTILTVISASSCDPNTPRHNNSLAVLGDILKDLIAQCKLSELEFKLLEKHATSALNYFIPERRRVFSHVYYGVVKSSINDEIIERTAIPTLLQVLEGGETIIRADIVYILARAMRTFQISIKMKVVWPEIMRLWYCRQRTDTNSQVSAISSMCELLRDDRQMCTMSEVSKRTVSNFLYTVAEYVTNQCERSESDISRLVEKLLNCFASNLVNVLKIVDLVDDNPTRRQMLLAVHSLCRCNLLNVRKSIASRFPQVCEGVLSWNTVTRTDSASSSNLSPRIWTWRNVQPKVLHWPLHVGFNKGGRREVRRLQKSFIKLLEDNDKRVRVVVLNGLVDTMKAFFPYGWTYTTDACLRRALGRAILCGGQYAESIVEEQVKSVWDQKARQKE